MVCTVCGTLGSGVHGVWCALVHELTYLLFVLVIVVHVYHGNYNSNVYLSMNACVLHTATCVYEASYMNVYSHIVYS